MSRTGLLLLLLLVIGAFITTWMRSTTLGDSKLTSKQTPAADFFMENFQTQEYDDTGTITFTLTGSRLEYFTADDKSIINNPAFVIHPNTAANHWQVSAERALYHAKELNELYFEGNVIFIRPDTKDLEVLSLQADYMQVKLYEELITTTGETTIRSGKSWFTGHDMQADLKRGKLQLVQAKGNYVP